MRRRVVLTALTAAVAIAGCGGGDNRRGEIENYVQDVARVQGASASALRDANQTYADFVQRKIDGAVAGRRLRSAERAIRRARSSLAAVKAPADARGLRSLILAYYDQAADLALETTLLGTYEPRAQAALKPLARIDRRLQRELGSAKAAGAQARVLGRFADGLDGIVRRFARLHPPPLLASAHSTQVKRLKNTASIARRVQGALRKADSRSVAKLLLRFRKLAQTRPQPVTQTSVQAYQQRYLGLNGAAAAVERERRRLEATLK